MPHMPLKVLKVFITQGMTMDNEQILGISIFCRLGEVEALLPVRSTARRWVGRDPVRQRPTGAGRGVVHRHTSGQLRRRLSPDAPMNCDG